MFGVHFPLGHGIAQRLNVLGGHIDHLVRFDAVDEEQQTRMAQGLHSFNEGPSQFQFLVIATLDVVDEDGDVVVGACGGSTTLPPALADRPHGTVVRDDRLLIDIVRKVLGRIPREDRPHAGYRKRLIRIGMLICGREFLGKSSGSGDMTD